MELASISPQQPFPVRPFGTLAQPLTIEWAHGAVAQRERASLAWKRSRVRFPPAPPTEASLKAAALVLSELLTDRFGVSPTRG